MKLRLPTILEVVSCLCAFAWFCWHGWVDRYTRDAYLLDSSVKWIILALAFSLGALVTWRAYKREKNTAGMLTKLKTLSATFIIVFGFVGVALWHVPEAIVVATAHQTVSNVFKFRMAYPGPSCGKHCRCTAGVIYYDPYLKREIEFCHWEDAPSFFYTDYIRVDKLVSPYGGKVIHHEAIHE
jgi:hypothetical protein